ncbi:MAG: N-acetylmuramoyl-L-alanine amidase [Candidatus Cloacimonetes bacterium]|nr:N-acetylmuramoyl-L-alanine amidase [Candidatus Cloacimonadota bacterium]
MKKIIIIIILLSLTFSLFANEYTISYVNSSRKDHLQIYQLQNRSYIDIYDLIRVFEAKLDINPNLQTIDFTIFNKKCRFFFDNKWVKFGKKNYNLYDNIKIQDGNFYIPKYFLNLCANKFFPDCVVINNNRIIVNLTAMEQYLIKRIVIDPGHGGKDPGAVGRILKLKEKDIVLNIAKETKQLLENNLDVEILLTREDDRFVSLGDRTEFANNHQADLFVSIHCNASRNTRANGTEVYYLSPAKTTEARAVEALENDAIRFEDPESIKRYTDLDFILYDMRQSEYLIESIDLTEMCQKSLVKELGTNDKGVKHANFYVLRGAFMPAILVEVAFLSNKWEEQRLKSNWFQNQAAKAIYESIKQFKEKYDKMN